MVWSISLGLDYFINWSDLWNRIHSVGSWIISGFNLRLAWYSKYFHKNFRCTGNSLDSVSDKVSVCFTHSAYGCYINYRKKNIVACFSSIMSSQSDIPKDNIIALTSKSEYKIDSLLLSLPQCNLYVIICKCSDNVLYVHLIPRPSLEYSDMQYWDFRLGNHKGCCIYTSLLIRCTFQNNTQPRCTISQQQLLILLDQHTIITLVGVKNVVGMTSVTRKPLRTARTPWIRLSTCKGEKRRSRISLLLKNE